MSQIIGNHNLRNRIAAEDQSAYTQVHDC